MLRINVLTVLLFLGLTAIAQNRKLSGVVTDGTTGKGIPSATVSIKGNKGSNRATDADGRFSLSVVNGKITLQVSAVGYVAKDLQVDAGTNEVTVSLAQSVENLSEVVVTALGIRREKKTLTYASQSINGDELRKAANINFMDALSGKAAGVNIFTSSSGAGGSTKVVLRGNKSLNGLSEPLYVIDGIPMVNNKGGQPGSYGGTDQGDGLSAINPEDIESMTVLRGANAALLYGSQGANGVVVITTKRGRSGKVTVNFNSSTTFDKVFNLPAFQYDYGAVNGSDYSWAMTKGSGYKRGYIENFFRTGVDATNSVSIAGGSDKTSVYFSYANTSATGVMPTNTYTRHNITLNQSTKLLKDKLTLSSNVMLYFE